MAAWVPVKVKPRQRRIELYFSQPRSTPSDGDVWESMRCELWPEGASDHKAEVEVFCWQLVEPHEEFFVNVAEGTVLGMVEQSPREDLPGFAKEQLAYIEGLFVKTTFRGSRVARHLIAVAQDWSYDQKGVKKTAGRTSGGDVSANGS